MFILQVSTCSWCYIFHMAAMQQPTHALPKLELFKWLNTLLQLKYIKVGYDLEHDLRSLQAWYMGHDSDESWCVGNQA